MPGDFVRDQLTEQNLKKFLIDSFFLGNPMMDHLEEHRDFKEFNPHWQTIVLLPGSRVPEVYPNFERMIAVISLLKKQELNIAMNLTPQTEESICQKMIKAYPIKIHLLQNSFAPLLNKADLALSMSGTAAEQAIGKGLPVVSMPGAGPQFVKSFAERQKLLLGKSYHLISGGPDKVARCLEDLLKNPSTELNHKNALERMGTPGGSQKIAEKIGDILWKQ